MFKNVKSSSFCMKLNSMSPYGSVIYIPERNVRLSFRSPEYSSVFQTELMTILKDVSITDWNIAV